MKQTMSSLEIANLTGKQHFHVIRDIENMLKELDNPNLDSLTLSSTYKDSNGIDRKKYDLDKELTYTLITGYSIKLRNAVTQ